SPTPDEPPPAPPPAPERGGLFGVFGRGRAETAIEPAPPPAETVEPPAPEAAAPVAPPAAAPEPPAGEEPERRGGLFGRFRKLNESVQRTRDTWFYRLDRILDQRAVSEELYEVLIQADVGVETSEKIVAGLRKRVKDENIRVGTDARVALKELLIAMLPSVPYAVP